MKNDIRLDNLFDGIIVLTSDGKFRYWNKKAEAIFNSEFKNEDEQDLQAVFAGNNLKLLKKVIQSKNPLEQIVELEGLTNDGGQIPLEISVSKFIENKEEYYTLVIRDITEKKLKSNIYNFIRDFAFSIKKQESLKCVLELTIESIQKISLIENGGMFLFKHFPVIVEEEFHHNENSELIDIVIESFFIDKVVAKLENNDAFYLDQFTAPKELFSGIDFKPITLIPILEKNTIVAVIYLIVDEKELGKIQQELINNISFHFTGEVKRIRVQNALVKSESKNRAILDALPDLMMHVDDSGNIINYRGSLKDFFGHEDNIANKNISEIFHEDISALISIMILRTIKTGIVQQFEYNINIEKKQKYFDGRMSILNDNEIIIIIRDITRIKQTQVSLAKSQKNLAELNARKDKFFSILAHDLRSPFIGLLGYADMLKNEYSSLERDEIKTFASSIHRSSKKIFSLLENLLHWSRLQTNRMDFKPIEFNLTQLIDHVISLFNMNFKEKNILLEREISEELFVYADQFMVETTLRNLISNSIKFSFKDGTIKVSAKKKNGIVKVIVADNGVGMSKETKQSLFDISKANSTRGTNNEEGTGLGLILCKEFVIKNNGDISVESELGTGSKFSFTIACP